MLIGFASLFALTAAPAAATEPESVHYIEVKSIEPLAVEKATDLATNFFKEKYPNRWKNYFIQKAEYQWVDKTPHCYSWEIFIYGKPGHGITLGDPFSVTLLVSPEGKVTLEHEQLTGRPD